MLFGVAEIHNFSFVFDLVIDTGGLSFPKAIQQIFCGVYFLELSLTGLFFLVRNADDSGVPCKVQGILMVVLIVLTILFQALLYHEVWQLGTSPAIEQLIALVSSSYSTPTIGVIQGERGG